jgi:hypothetical protein
MMSLRILAAAKFNSNACLPNRQAFFEEQAEVAQAIEIKSVKKTITEIRRAVATLANQTCLSADRLIKKSTICQGRSKKLGQ